jgi:hypothetical protein
MTFAGAGCGGATAALVNACAYDDNGVQVVGNVTITAVNFPADYLVDPMTGNHVRSVTVANCTSVQYSNTAGPFSAQLANGGSRTQNGVIFTGVPCVPFIPSWYKVSPIWWHGPIDTQQFFANIINNTVDYTAPRPDPAMAQDSVQFVGNAQQIASTVTVQAWSIAALSAQLDVTPEAAVNWPSGSVKSVGGTLVVTAGSAQVLPAPAALSFAIPQAPPTGSTYKILHLGGTASGNVWQEIPLSSASGPITATTTMAGPYMLALCSP